MTIAEKREALRELLQDATMTDAVADIYLSMASEMILNTRYPFVVPEGAVVEQRWEMTQVELAAAIKRRRDSGASADMTQHSENAAGTSVMDVYADYTNSGMSPYAPYLLRIVPVAKVVTGK